MSPKKDDNERDSATQPSTPSQPGLGARSEKRVPGGSNPAQDGIERSMGQVVVSAQEESMARHARVRARALQIEPRNRRERLRVIQEISGSGDYVRGETAPILAEAWGLATNTVEGDATVAWHIIQASSDEVDRGIFKAEADALLDSAKDILSVTTELVRKTDVPMKVDQMSGEVVGPDWMGIQGLAGAMGKAHETVLKTVELIGKASGILQSGKQTNTSVRIDLGNGQIGEGSKAQLELENKNGFTWIRFDHPELADEYDEKVLKTAARGEEYVPTTTVEAGEGTDP